MNAVEFDRVSKSYPVYDSASGRLKELAAFGRKRFHRDFQALRDVSFSIRRGEVFCIIGANGSGKSTALQLMAGILQPTSGEVRASGRVAALLELGAGFNNEFTGRENVYLNGAILGLTKRDMDARYGSIEEFAEIGDFIDRPVRTYSSGMVMRLGFAVAISVEPEILLVDEALAVGDTAFRRRCMRRIQQLRAGGVTIVFVTHSVSEAMSIGERVLWMRHGQVAALGSPGEVVPRYIDAMRGNEAPLAAAASVVAVTTIPNIDHRRGDGRAEVLGIAILNEFGEPLQFMSPESQIIVRISFRAREAMARPVAGFLLRNHLGLDFAAVSTEREGCLVPAIAAGEIRTIDFQMEIPELYPGAFSFSPWIQEGDAVCDWIDNAVTLQMGRGEGPVYGYVHWPTRVELAGKSSNG
ncbi:MAG: transporter related [Bryobacterales bacterium]|nr:transporter related [Bryobacterales bacterium]